METPKLEVSTLTFKELFKKFFPDGKITSELKNIQTHRLLKKFKLRVSALNKKILLKLTAAFIVILAVILLLLEIGGRSSGTFTGSNRYSQKSVNLSKTFQFAGSTENGRSTEDFVNLTLTNVEMTKQILIQGKPATAKDGKIFLIINLEIDNPHNTKLFISPVDLIRLVDKNGKKFAPDVHNNQVAVEPISVKKTRVGFVVDEGVSGWKLQIGEVSGAKEQVDLPI